ncbi:type VII secretion protein EccB [Pseudonocardia endophytica]|uniref:Type VII secretion system ESX-1 transmembrane protein B n=1 Tax=Pseudonocardia endophytica TaxID=401976 RepID=A0A4R1HE63_PSEEN|nr:type VII secretion protein EccB [Pseudonocardia endophytica]TCK20364.1 type VII secretion system ESX-1 transmembrane protein B [Pseudonocardia endophytica]
MTVTETPAGERTTRRDPDAPPARALRAPATRDQVDAHRFGQRRLEAALVRADPVPLHEQLRAQRRASLAGIALGLLGLGGAFVLAHVVPDTQWQTQSLVVGERSGTVYAVTPANPGPQQLVPVPDMLAGRLVLAALGSPAPTAVPVTVSDDTLATAPRTPPADVAGAVGVRPDGPPVPPDWAVCDTNPDPAGGGTGATTVLAGSLGPSAPAGGLLLAAQGGSTSVVLDGVRHRIDPDDTPAMSALGLLDVAPRQVADGLLSALPEGAPLRTPDIAGGSGGGSDGGSGGGGSGGGSDGGSAGSGAGSGGGPGRGTTVGELGRVGDVVTSNPLGGGEMFFVVLGPSAGRPAGVLPIPATLADAIRTATGQGTPATMAENLIARNTIDDGPGRGVDPSGWPSVRLPKVDPASSPSVCWTWRDGRTGLSAGDRLPVADGAVTVDLAAADGAGPRPDAVVLPASGTGPIESRGSTGGGTRWLLSTTGALHGLADDRTAEALGVTTAGRAPEEALRLLPRAPALDLSTVRDVRDVAGN